MAHRDRHADGGGRERGVHTSERLRRDLREQEEQQRDLRRAARQDHAHADRGAGGEWNFVPGEGWPSDRAHEAG